MKREKMIKLRANDYEKELVALIVATANQAGAGSINVLTESDIIRMAIDDMALKYLKKSDISKLKKKHGI